MSTDGHGPLPGPAPENPIWQRNNAYRQITAVFVDLVESSALMQGGELDDYTEFLNEFQDLCSRSADASGGYVAEYMGDGVLLFFGYPKVGDADQINALSCALLIAEEARSAEFRALAPGFGGLRIGIATGQSILDRAQDAETTWRAVGNCLNKAARIQAIAEANAVAVCANTVALARDLFSFRDIGVHELKGFAEPEHLFQLTGRRAAGAASDLTADALGRAAEIARVADLHRAARAGGGAVALVTGEPGIGKSHFLRRMTRELSPEAAPPLLACSPISAKATFIPVAELLEATSLRHRPDQPDGAADRIRHLLAGVWDLPPPLVEVLVPVLLPATVTVDEGNRLNMSGARAQALDMVADRLLTEVTDLNGGLLVAEDLHWADASTLDFLRLLAAKVARSGVLILASSRPEGPAAEGGLGPAMDRIELRPLDRQDGIAILRRLRPDLDAKQAERAYDSSGGVPLLIEEYAQIIGKPGLGEMRNARSAVPVTMHALVQTKLDRLGISAQRLVEVGAVIGQQFPVSTAGAIASLTDAQCQDVLGHLTTLDLIRATAAAAGGRQVIDFKHALISDAVYASIPGRRRALIHRAVAQHYLDSGEAVSPAVLASHYDAAGDAAEAARHFLTAARAASHLGDPVETLTQVTKALSAISRMEGGDAVELEVAARSMEGLARMVMQGPGSADFGASAMRARTLLQDSGAAPRGQVLFGAGLHSWASGQYDQANVLIGELREMPLSGDDHGPVFAADLIDGLVHWHTGRSDEALDRFTRVHDAFVPDRDDGLYSAYLMDFHAFSGFYSALCLSALGRHDEARACAAATAEAAKPRMRPHPIGFTMLAGFLTAMFAGEADETARLTDTCIEHSSTFGFPEFIALAQGAAGWVALVRGEAAEGASLIETGRQGWAATGFRSWEGLFAALGLAAMSATGADATRAATRALDTLSGTGEAQFQPLLAALAGTPAEAADARLSPGFLVAAANGT